MKAESISPQVSAASATLKIIVIIVLILITLGVFSQVRHFQFLTYDDHLYISENPYVQDGLTWKGIEWAFKTGLLLKSPTADYWRPISHLSAMLDTELFGLNPSWHHLMNLLIHILNIVLLFLILTQLTGALWQSAFVAILFAIHPLQIGSVAWISERKDVLSALFGFSALKLYVEYCKIHSVKRYLAAGFCFTLSLMTKPLFVSLPFIFLLLDYWPLKRFHSSEEAISRLFLEKWVFFLLSLIICFLTWSSSAAQIVTQIKIVSVIYLRYLINFFVPSYILIYPWKNLVYSEWVMLGSSVVLLFVSYNVIRYRSKYPYLLVGWFWFLVTLAPMLRLRFENHYMYLPMIGILIMTAWGIPGLFQNEKVRASFCLAFILPGVIACAIRTYHETALWKDDDSFFQQALSRSSEIDHIHYLYGISLARRKKIDEALPHFLQILQKPPDIKAYNDIITILLSYIDLDDMDKRISLYKKAVQIRPDYRIGYQALCDAYVQHGAQVKTFPYCQEAPRI